MSLSPWPIASLATGDESDCRCLSAGGGRLLGGAQRRQSPMKRIKSRDRFGRWRRKPRQTAYRAAR